MARLVNNPTGELFPMPPHQERSPEKKKKKKEKKECKGPPSQGQWKHFLLPPWKGTPRSLTEIGTSS
jgi:hypothetical protein